MDIILVAGLWLPVSVWDAVVVELGSLGHRATAVALPGVDDGSASGTLDDQLDAVLAAVDAAGRPLVVGHSAASTLAWLAADRRSTTITGVVMIGGFPSRDGAAYADFFPVVDGVMTFPGWEPFEGADSADLDEAARAALDAVVIPVPGTVAQATVAYHDERRSAVPVVLVCPEFSPDDARSWVASGDLPELAAARHVDFVDIDSGHWPMVTRPGDLARLLDRVARGI